VVCITSPNRQQDLESIDWIELAYIIEISVAWTVDVGLHRLQLQGYNGIRQKGDLCHLEGHSPLGSLKSATGP